MILELIIYALVIVAIWLSISIARAFGGGVLGVTFYYFAVSFFLVGLHRMFPQVADGGFYMLQNVTEHLWVHLIFYFGILAFILGARRLNSISNPSSSSSFGSADVFTLGFLTLVPLTVFVIAQPLEPIMATMFVGSIVDTFGLHHFLAFIFAVVAAWYVWSMKKNFGARVYPFLALLFLMGVQHFWETLTESWRVIMISQDTAELIEKFILIPSLVLLTVGLYRIYLFLKPSRNSPTRL